MMDLILREMYRLVQSMERPEDSPIDSDRVSRALHLEGEDILPQFRFLSEEGMLKISPICDPPLLYLTKTGISRVRRLIQP
ncbi:hypothetical protein [Rufibacter radiotolerans]|nr:hypothetical protein [Rufibacter radiotolerans]